MIKSRLSICILLLITLFIAGCSNDSAKSNNSKDSSSEQPSVIIGNTYVNNISEQTFYCMRVKGNSYKIYNTDCSADSEEINDVSNLFQYTQWKSVLDLCI
ncbi:MAG: hypothetical protein IKG30_04170 [Clostridiales bacterium]|nr:hypothetical protein [Clostridiales bacterium]